ncbi:MAG: acyl-CoA dehydrogenase family protein, partial [Hyphomicrobiaceae bacterium]|nr:acyl-CoA dehydrogenase family protein [Hyphomicrobiaceae bacterium]
MPTAALATDAPDDLGVVPAARLFERTGAVVADAQKIVATARTGVRARIEALGGIDAAQHVAHGFAWLATTAEGLAQMHAWASRLEGEGRFGEMERLILLVAFSEYASQIAGGIPMSQVETIRAHELGVPRRDLRAFEDASADVIAAGADEALRARLADLIALAQGATTYGDAGLDETHAEIHEQMRRFSLAEVVPHAHEWHLANAYIPMEIVEKVGELGVFGLTIPEDLG